MFLYRKRDSQEPLWQRRPCHAAVSGQDPPGTLLPVRHHTIKIWPLYYHCFNNDITVHAVRLAVISLDALTDDRFRHKGFVRASRWDRALHCGRQVVRQTGVL